MINELTRKNAHTELDHIFKTILPAHGMTERPEQIRLSHTMLDAMFENRIALSDACLLYTSLRMHTDIHEYDGKVPMDECPFHTSSIWAY